MMTRLIFTIGMKMIPVLLGWYLYELTGSKLALGMLGLSEVIPAILFALPAGVKVDTSAKKSLIKKCISGYIIILIMMLYVISEYSLFKDSITFTQYLIFILVGLTGWLRAYISPSFSAIIAQLVPQDSLVQAAS
ncbi:MAG: MFS transporter [Saprospiraceae bacterium]|nr:MFS transporter [Saprospiraceae bacterium]